MKIYDNETLIAYSKGDSIYLVEGTPEPLVPIEIFNIKSLRNSNKSTMDLAYEWLCDRVVPRTRFDIDDVLAEMGLVRYDVLDIIRATEGRAFGDNFTVVLEEGDFSNELY